jgi:integrase
MREAEDVLTRRRVEVFIAEERAKTGTKPPLLLSEMMKQYIEGQHNEISRKSVERASRHILLNFKEGPVASVITPDTFDQYINTRLTVERASKSSLWSEIKALRAALSKAVKLKQISYEILRDLKEINPPEKPDTRLEYFEVDDLIRVLRCSQSWIHPPIITAVYTGMRLDELCTLTWKNLDLTEGYLHLPETKNSARRDVPIMPTIRDMLRLMQKANPRNAQVFKAARANRLRHHNLEQAFRDACLRARREKFDFHHTRHTFASWAVMAGIDLYVVQELMGHKDVESTRIYAHLSPNHMTKQVYWLESEKTSDKSDKPIVSRFRLLKEYFTVGDGRGQLHPLVFPA